jgi:hypothetical protein
MSKLVQLGQKLHQAHAIVDDGELGHGVTQRRGLTIRWQGKREKRADGSFRPASGVFTRTALLAVIGRLKFLETVGRLSPNYALALTKLKEAEELMRVPQVLPEPVVTAAPEVATASPTDGNGETVSEATAEKQPADQQ